MPVSPWWEIAVRLTLAAFLGGVIGFERERRGKPAGLRTHMLVSVAAAVFVLSAQEAAIRAGESVDSVRAMSGVAQGVGVPGGGRHSASTWRGALADDRRGVVDGGGDGPRRRHGDVLYRHRRVGAGVDHPEMVRRR